VNRGLALAAVALLTVAACGVSTETRARTTEPAEVPFGLAENIRRSPPDTALPPVGPVAELYFLDEAGRLVATTRQLHSDRPDAVVAALLAGPTSREADAGLGTAFPDEDAVRSVDVTGGVAAVNLAGSFVNLDGEAQRSALAQLVYTLTARPGIGRVSLTLEEQPVEIPRGDGTLTTGSVSRDSYREMQPAP
jgi:spore germination protein GerM